MNIYQSISNMQEKEANIKKAVLNGRHLTVTYVETYAEGDKDITVKSEIPAHKDCTDAFKKLIPHFILLTEMKESDQVSHLAASMGIENIPEEDEFKNADVYGIKMGKNDSNVSTVTLMGQRFLKTGGSVDFSSLAQSLESDDSEFEYPYINELNLAIQAVLYEVKEYLFNGKYAIIQKEIQFEAAVDAPFEAEVGKMVDTDTGAVTTLKIEKPKRGRRPKRETLTATPAC